MFHRRRYLRYLKTWQDRFEAEGRPVSHDRFGFPLVLYPGVYPCHPDYSHSTQVLIDGLPGRMDGLHVLDLGTGNGVIAIAAARRGATVVACDVEPQAVAAAANNVGANGLAGRVRVVASDVFDALAGSGDRFDLIAANLWYPIAMAGYSGARDEALAALRRLLRHYANHLRPGGVVLLGSAEFADRGAVRALFREAGIAPRIAATRAAYDGGRIAIDWLRYEFPARDGRP